METRKLPLINVDFYISSDSVDPDIITTILGLKPTKIRRKEDWPLPSIKAGMACNLWALSTEQETSKSVDEMCRKIIDKLKGKEEFIQSLCNDSNIEMHFEVVIHMSSMETPEIYLEKETIKFLAIINADIGFDVYTYEEDD